ncbi:hypothetical protein [Hymenobacter lutimineralis]|uniref:hypothetical protein n=1 Tax=Hymenobacter lutimineralis TaxID=2606448 RepID=UPI001CA3E495|nr:hypothetical protein [Hymenobacter lutimineralis]
MQDYTNKSGLEREILLFMIPYFSDISDKNITDWESLVFAVVFGFFVNIATYLLITAWLNKEELPRLIIMLGHLCYLAIMIVFTLLIILGPN